MSANGSLLAKAFHVDGSADVSAAHGPSPQPPLHTPAHPHPLFLDPGQAAVLEDVHDWLWCPWLRVPEELCHVGVGVDLFLLRGWCGQDVAGLPPPSPLPPPHTLAHMHAPAHPCRTRTPCRLGVACGEGGHITATDNDRIEVSNLSRQFLFRETNVGQNKSTAASEAVRAMNPAIQVRRSPSLLTHDLLCAAPGPLGVGA